MKNNNCGAPQFSVGVVAKRVALGTMIAASLFATSGIAIGATSASVTLYGTNAETPSLTQTLPGTPASLSSQGTSLGGATYYATGSGYSTPGFLSVQAQAAATAPNFGVPEGAAPRVDASASWSDLITVNAPGQAGHFGYITATIQFTGGMDVTASPNNGVGAAASAASSVGFQVPGFGIAPTYSVETTSPNFVNQSTPVNNLSYNIGVSFGSATGIGYVLGAFLRADASNYYGTNPDMNSTSLATATLRWTGISGVFLSDGTPVNSSGLTVTSESGFNYLSAFPESAIPAVPEPESYALMLAGLAIVGAIARRQRRNAITC